MARRKSKLRSIYVTKEPDWKTLKLLTEIEQQEDAFRSCEYFVRTEISKTKGLPTVKDWIKNHSGWSDEDIKIVLANPDWALSNAIIPCYTYHKLGYMPESVKLHFEKRKEEWIPRGKKTIAEKKLKAESKPQKKVISIQDRMRDQVTDLCAEFEFFIDQMVDGNKTVKDFDPYKMMIVYQPEIKGPHAKIIKEEFEGQHAEALEVKDWKDEQIKEAYSHMDLKMRKAFVQVFEKINTACDTIIQTKATTRKARKPKARSKESIIKKMKFQINDSDLGVASIHPTEVVNANEIWVYNTKTRKVGVYHAMSKDPRGLGRPGSGLMVKGTTIQDFNEDLSIQKTLRKPKEQINNWTGNAKTKFAKAFEEVKTTPIKLNGRMNDNTIILKAF